MSKIIVSKDIHLIPRILFNLVLLFLFLSPFSLISLIIDLPMNSAQGIFITLIFVLIGNSILFFMLYLLVSIRYIHIHTKKEREKLNKVFTIDPNITFTSNIMAVLTIEAFLSATLLIIYVLKFNVLVLFSSRYYMVIYLPVFLMVLGYIVKWFVFLLKLICIQIDSWINRDSEENT